MKTLNYWLVFAFVIFSAGCATVFKGGTSSVEFNSSPMGAEVSIDGMPRGKTPLKLELASNKSYNVVFKKDGKTQSFTISNKLGATWLILDIVSGLFPVIIDAATGNWYDLDQKTMTAYIE